jgi:hypothetical protein
MMEQLRDFISYFENSALADNIRENDVAFALIESLHVVSICLVVGSISAVDLRLLGLASTDRSVSRVMNGILPLTWSAFAVAVASGSLLFISNATKYLDNGYFDAKIFLICAAGLNMAMFHALSAKDLPRWENDTRPPLPARLAGGLSILLWVAVVACGRWIGFTMEVRLHDQDLSIFRDRCCNRHCVRGHIAVDVGQCGPGVAVPAACRHKNLHGTCP